MSLAVAVSGALAGALAITACSSDESAELGTIGFVEGYLGGVVSDEPRAALVGRDILAAGGTAADAAVGVYFALSVTQPSSAGLGGGGVCVVHDRKQKRVEALEFLARAPKNPGTGASRPTAIPGNVRGFFALYSKYGRLRWSQLVAPAETLARFGMPVSRAFAKDLVRVEKPLLADPSARRIFGHVDPSGAVTSVLREGETLTQLDLSATLSRLRARGPGDFYSGQLAAQLTQAVGEAGGALDRDELRHSVPKWVPTVRIPFGNEWMHFAPPPAAGGTTAAAMWSMLAGPGDYADADAITRMHLLAETGARAFTDREQWMIGDGNANKPVAQILADQRIRGLMAGYQANRHTAPGQAFTARPENPSASSFITVDGNGSAVACSVTMNNLFGTGRVAPGTGILLASAPGNGGRGAQSLGPMMVINENVNEFYFAAAASGGVTAPTAMISVAARYLLGGEKLESALAAGRVHHSGSPDLVYHEQSVPLAIVNGLSQRGHRTAASGLLGRVNAIGCREGLPPKPESCRAAVDPRGSGMAVSAN